MTTTVQEQLIELIRANTAIPGGDFELSQIGPECMETFGRFDWQSYVPSEVRGLWRELSEESRLVAFVYGRQSAYLDDPGE